MDSRDDYAYGYSPKGERLYALKSGRRTGRVNMIAAWCNQQLLAPFTIEGACNRSVFEVWLETCLLPTLKPGQKLVIDNATFHKGGRIEELVKAAGCEVWANFTTVSISSRILPFQWFSRMPQVRSIGLYLL